MVLVWASVDVFFDMVNEVGFCKTALSHGGSKLGALGVRLNTTTHM